MNDKKEEKQKTIEKPKPKISMLVYGKAGSGKSILASTFPSPLIIDADAGHKIYESQEVFPDAMYVRGGQCLPALKRAIGQIKEGNNKFETLVIDSLTALENKSISEMKGLRSNNWDSTLYTNRGKKLGFDHWGNLSGSTIALLTELKEYPINVVIVTQVANINDGGRLIFKPELVGKGQNESLHFADVVGYMEKLEGSEGIQRTLHLASSESDVFEAKARSAGGYISPITNPNYQKLLKALTPEKVNLKF